MAAEGRPSTRRRATIRVRLLVAMLLTTLVTGLVITAASVTTSLRGGYRHVLNQLDSVATLKEAEISNWIRDCQLDLSVDTASPGAASELTSLMLSPPSSAAWQEAHRYLLERFRDIIRQERRLDEMFVMDRQGEVVLSTKQAIEGQFRGLQTYFQEGIKRPGAHVQTLSFSSTSEGVNTVVIVRPIRDRQGRAIGVLAGRAGLGTLNHIMQERAGLGATGETYLVGSNYVLLTELRFGGYAAGRKYLHSTGIDAAIGRHARGAGGYRDYRGAEVIGVYRWLPDLQVALLAEQDRAEAFRPVYVGLAINTGVALLAVLAAVLLSVRISGSIARPLSRLSRTASEIAGGNLDLTVPVGRKDEVGVLGEAFNDMTGRLRETISGLENQVGEVNQARRALQDSEVRYRRIVNTATEGVWLISKDLKTVFVNSAMSEMLGYLAAEMVGRPVTDFLDEDEGADHLRRMERRFQGISEKYERRFRRRDGHYIWTWVSATPVYDDNHKIIGSLAMMTDITERKRAEDEVHALNQELEWRVAERTEELRRTVEELEGFSYSVSHDLRAPLRAIDGFSRLLLDKHYGQLGEDGRRYLDNIHRNALRMGDLIEDLLAFSRMSRKTLSMAPVDMTALVESAFEEVRPRAADRDVVLRVEDLPTADGDEPMLRQVVVNLLSNAVKFTSPREHAVIEVSGWAEGAENVYRVRDNGVGFDMRFKDKMFGVFERLHRSDEFEGTGIGLAIVEHVIVRHGGRVWAEGVVDEGSSFYFTLPHPEPVEAALLTGRTG